MDRRLFGSFVLLALAGIFILACDITSVVTTKPIVTILSPSNGAEVREGDEIGIHSVSTDSTGVLRVELSVDGNVIRTDPVPGGAASFSITQTWKAVSGTHTLGVQAYSQRNVASDASKIKVRVLPRSADTTPVVFPTIPITGTSGESCTLGSSFISDATVPDGTLLAGGQAFFKIWRVRNTGSCTWGPGYQLAFGSGEAMTTTTTMPLPATAPGATADLIVGMAAPMTPGSHAGFWRLKGPGGSQFGSLSIRIEVIAAPAPEITEIPATPTPTPLPVPCSGTPNIASFSASPTTISFGESATLSWGFVSNADSAEINQDIGGVATPGSMVITPTTTITYTMVARCGNKSSSKQATVQVLNPGFAVTGINVSVSPASAMTCPAAFTFSGTINANGAGTVTYRWERSDGSNTTTQAVTFANADTQTVTNQWTLGAAGSGWARLHILSPNDLVSNQAAVTLICNQSFQVTNVIASVSPISYTAACPGVFDLTGEITANGPGTVTYRWDKSDGSSSTVQSVDFSGLGSQTVNGQWSGPPVGAGWVKLHILTPRELISGQADLVNGCR